ncbi:MAG: hypothetical protein HOM51_08800 [Rhodospirillaceae bacterium]|jgi:hypothetical protein|nr:hypothetical protein [Rhodospirillaceae bacterium]
MSTLMKEETKNNKDHIEDILVSQDNIVVAPIATEAANEDVPTNTFARILWSWTETSYKAWVKSGKIESF